MESISYFSKKPETVCYMIYKKKINTPKVPI